MKDLVEYIARALVDHPDAVEVTETTTGGRSMLTLKVEATDMGRVIGKQGRIAQAIRTLLKVAAVRGDLPDRQPTLVIAALDGTVEAMTSDAPPDIDEDEDEPAGI